MNLGATELVEVFALQEGAPQDIFLPGHTDPLTLILLCAAYHADFPGKQGFGGFVFL